MLWHVVGGTLWVETVQHLGRPLGGGGNKDSGGVAHVGGLEAQPVAIILPGEGYCGGAAVLTLQVLICCEEGLLPHRSIGGMALRSTQQRLWMLTLGGNAERLTTHYQGCSAWQKGDAVSAPVSLASEYTKIADKGHSRQHKVDR